MRNNKKGFTLAELLVVVAIIGVLVAISIPVFNSQLEKSRRAVDISNARSIQSALSVMINSGDIDLSTATGTDKGVWVIVARDGTKIDGYSQKFTFFVGANKGVTLFGVPKTTEYYVPNEQLTNEIMKCFGNNELKSKSAGFGTKLNDIEGWDWYIVQYYYDDGDYKCRIYSGESGKPNGMNQVKYITGIEKWMGRQ